MHNVRPMECERTRQWLSAALDCELSPFERALVNSHLVRCGACSSFEAQVSAFTDAVRAARPVRMAGRVYVPARRRFVATNVARLGSVAAIFVAVVSVGLLATPDRSALGGGEQALVASSLHRSASVNDLVVELRRPAQMQGQAIAYGAGGIGAYKPPLVPTP